jgi:hypothetical protein
MNPPGAGTALSSPGSHTVFLTPLFENNGVRDDLGIVVSQGRWVKTYKQRNPPLLPFDWLLVKGPQGHHCEWAVERSRRRRRDYTIVAVIGMVCSTMHQCARGDPDLYGTILAS